MFIYTDSTSVQSSQLIMFFLNHTSSALADTHSVAVCVSNRKYSEIGGTPFSVSYTWAKEYEILTDATECACDYYRNRNTGDKQWDQCPDCTFVR